TIFLGIIYIGVAYLGATSTGAFGLFDTGGPVLGKASSYYFGTFGTVMLSVIILLACLTTSIGLMTACGEYFHTLVPKVSYKMWVLFFSLVSFVIANFGLSNIIKFSIPVLMFLYPLAVALMLLTFLSKLFNHSQMVYVAAITVTTMISIIDGFKTFCQMLEIDYFGWLAHIVALYERILPLYNDGLGWLLPVLVTILITSILANVNFAGFRGKNKTESAIKL
ncbi:MAG: branched-chain amino acid transport system II carrier protein, partial [Bacillus sp. (in: firmicutes)]